MNQDELEVVKQEMARVNTGILLTKVDGSGKIYFGWSLYLLLWTKIP